MVGVDFERDERVDRLLSDPQAPAMLLYPAADARDLRRDPPAGPITLVVLDGTWSQARNLLRTTTCPSVKDGLEAFMNRHGISR